MERSGRRKIYAVLLGKEPGMSLADSRDNIDMILGLFKSARTGNPVML